MEKDDILGKSLLLLLVVVLLIIMTVFGGYKWGHSDAKKQMEERTMKKPGIPGELPKLIEMVERALYESEKGWYARTFAEKAGEIVEEFEEAEEEFLGYPMKGDSGYFAMEYREVKEGYWRCYGKLEALCNLLGLEVK